MIPPDLRGLSRRVPFPVVLIPSLLATLVLLPRLLSPQFGLFDDGVTLMTVRQILAGEGSMWEFGLGRFRPTYWVYWLALEVIGSGNPFIYFLGNLILLLGTSWLISIALIKFGLRWPVAALAGSLFVISGPVVENYYTLSKAEPIQVFLIALSLLLLVSVQKWNGGFPSRRLLAVAACLLLAMGAKETTVVIVPISAVWLSLSLLATRRRSDPRIRLSATYLGCGLVAVASYTAVRWVGFGIPLYGAGYTQRYSLELASLLPSLVRWLAWTLRLFPYLGSTAILAAIVWRSRKSEAEARTVVASIVWLVGWLAIIIPWTVSAGYFLLPFGLGAAVLTAVVLDWAWTMIDNAQGWPRSISLVLVATIAALIVVGIVNGSSMARLQLAVDRANHEVIEWLGAELPVGSRLLVNIQTENEYLDEIGIHLQSLNNRSDIEVGAYQEASDLTIGSSAAVYIMAAEVEDQMAFSVRHGVIESSLESWNRELQQVLPESATLAFATLENHQLIDFALLRIACPLDDSLLYCQGSKPLIDLLRFRYGWSVYAVE